MAVVCCVKRLMCRWNCSFADEYHLNIDLGILLFLEAR